MGHQCHHPVISAEKGGVFTLLSSSCCSHENEGRRKPSGVLASLAPVSLVLCHWCCCVVCQSHWGCIEVIEVCCYEVPVEVNKRVEEFHVMCQCEFILTVDLCTSKCQCWRCVCMLEFFFLPFQALMQQ